MDLVNAILTSMGLKSNNTEAIFTKTEIKNE